MELKELFSRCYRIIHISRKPTDAEFNKVAKVTALGMVVLGIAGLVLGKILSLF